MRLGLQIPRFNWSGDPAVIGPRLVEIVQCAETAGFSSIWLMDHLFQIPVMGEPEDPMLECYTTLGFLAHATARVTLGPMVGAVPYRHPSLLIKMATTLNVLAGGRTYFSIGAGWYEDEALGLGMDFPPLRERFALLEETARLARHMWSADRSPFDGQQLSVPNPVNSPQPVSAPPIMIGGNGERRTLALVAKHSDACNFLALPPEEVSRKVDILKSHCQNVGRSLDEIEITTLNPQRYEPGHLDPKELRNQMLALRNAGVQHAIINLPDVETLEPLEIIGREVIPTLSE